MSLLIFSFIYYFRSHLQCISRLCIVAVLKFIIKQHYFSVFWCCWFFFFFHLPVIIGEGGVQNYKNYAIPSFAYVGSAFSYVD